MQKQESSATGFRSPVMRMARQSALSTRGVVNAGCLCVEGAAWRTRAGRNWHSRPGNDPNDSRHLSRAWRLHAGGKWYFSPVVIYRGAVFVEVDCSDWSKLL